MANANTEKYGTLGSWKLEKWENSYETILRRLNSDTLVQEAINDAIKLEEEYSKYEKKYYKINKIYLIIFAVLVFGFLISSIESGEWKYLIIGGIASLLVIGWFIKRNNRKLDVIKAFEPKYNNLVAIFKERGIIQ